MAKPPRTSTRTTERRDRSADVMQAAIDVFYERGYAKASIQEVADRVGVLKGSLYHYIDSKEDLLASIFDESDEQSFALMEELNALEISALERLRSFAHSWSLWYLQNIERATVYINEWKHLTGKRREKALSVRRQYEARVEAMIEDVKREGDADPDLDTRYACFFILSAINGLPTWYRRRGADPAERIADVYSDMIVGTVRNAKGRPPVPKRAPGGKGAKGRK